MEQTVLNLTRPTVLAATFLLSAQAVLAQAVTGKVTAADSKDGLPGVTVVLKGTTVGAGTGPDGTFTLDIPNRTGTLVFSFVGYLTKEVPINGKSEINVTLGADTKALDEVVVVGYGTQKAGNVTGAITGVTAKEIEERPVNRIENALAGQMPGVYVQTQSGEPGQDLQIRVRGTGSINASNEPLYVVDGVPVDNLRGINPTDVANIEVLKDAASAAIYGSRGSNGVVIVTTKRGKKGKAKLQFSGFTGLQTVERRIDVMSPEQWIQQRKEGIDEAWVNRGKGTGVNKPYKASDPMSYRASELGTTLSNPNTTYMYDPLWQYGSDSLAYIDWQKEALRKAIIQQYQVGVSGGTDDFNYNVNASYLDQKGIFVGTGIQRATMRANFDAKIRKGVKLTMTLAPSMEWSGLGRVDGKDNQAMNAIQMPPVAPLKAGILVGAQPYNPYAWSGRYVSPIAVMERSQVDGTRTRLNANMGLNIDLVKNLQLQLLGAMDNNYYLDQQYYPTNSIRDWASYAPGAGSTSSVNQTFGTRYLFQGVFNYARKFGDHNINAILGYSVEQTQEKRSAQQNNKLPNDWTYLFDFANSNVTRSNVTAPNKTVLLSYFGRVQYDYKEKYLFAASLRRDGSSKFGRDRQFGYFPAFSAGWRVSGENFMQGVTFISDLKLRGSWGVTGNNRIGDNAQYSTLTPSNYPLGITGAPVNGYAPGNFPNPLLGWEQTKSFNVGFDFSVLNGRIQVTADAYDKKTTDLLYTVPVLAITGFSNSLQNLGDLRNQGVELGLNTQNLVGRLKWSTSFNASYNRNKVLRLGIDNTPVPAGFQSQTQILQVGQPLYSFLLYDAIGVYKTQAEIDDPTIPKMSTSKVGDSRYRDVNGDGVITSDDRTLMGNPQPKFIFGITNNFTFGNFDLNILTNAQAGGQVYSLIGRSIDTGGMGYLYNKLAKWEHRWKSEEDPGDGMTPGLTSSGAYYNTRWLYSSNYIRIKNIQLGYNLPRAGFYDRARVYLSVENAYIWHNYTGGFTPEAVNTDGGDYGGYPQARTYTIGFNLTL
ncbi:SusC/RagA family TonB-linked outer membrane protein [Hymenobacter crusticola]|uniref:TonB-dependent receptor plug domain-containing protein n=1 Tax=Hymenobacter crusticola TaxID=1770526 RepID=A0A243WKX8_9BACT|nr:TonB-dependent receptor [Hymenobacter crusticola]OUJ75821.1 hypothetical protein BXP70_00540 [Hymenobacter crusticola]